MNPVISMSSKCSSEWNCDHTDIFTTCEEVNIRVKENSDNPFDTGCRKRQLLSPTDLYSVLPSPTRSYSN